MRIRLLMDDEEPLLEVIHQTCPLCRYEVSVRIDGTHGRARRHAIRLVQRHLDVVHRAGLPL